MAELVERKIRARARQIYEGRGEAEGLALQDWVEAESEVLANSILAPLYRRLRGRPIVNQEELRPSDLSSCDNPA